MSVVVISFPFLYEGSVLHCHHQIALNGTAVSYCQVGAFATKTLYYHNDLVLIWYVYGW